MSSAAPWSVRVTMSVALLVAGGLCGIVLLSKACDHYWPWNRDPAHAVVHVQNGSEFAVTRRLRADIPHLLTGRPSWSPIVRGQESAYDVFHSIPGRLKVTCTLEFAPESGWPPVSSTVIVAPDEHVRLDVDKRGAVTVNRGKETPFGFAAWQTPVVAAVGGR